MNSADILSVIFSFLADDEDANSLLSCRLVCKKMQNVIDKYRYMGETFINTPFMKIAKLVNSKTGLSQFRASLLDLLLVQTQISPILSDTHRTIRFLQLTMVGVANVNIENALDRLIPDSTKLGNDQSYEPSPVLANHVITCINKWLHKWYVLDLSTTRTVQNPDNLQNLQQIEKSLDELFRLLVKYKILSDKLDWESDYNYYALNDSNNLELLLNKLKVIYQVTA